MNPDRLREVLAPLNSSQRGLADALGWDDRMVRRWASGDGEIPTDLAAWL